MPPIKLKSSPSPKPAKRQHKAAAKAVAQVKEKARPLTRIQREKQDIILEAALDVFSLRFTAA